MAGNVWLPIGVNKYKFEQIKLPQSLPRTVRNIIFKKSGKGIQQPCFTIIEKSGNDNAALFFLCSQYIIHIALKTKLLPSVIFVQLPVLSFGKNKLYHIFYLLLTQRLFYQLPDMLALHRK